MLSDSRISKALLPYGVSPDPNLCQRIRAYISFLLRWNARISLTTVTNPDEILKFHFGESFLAASIVPIQFGRLADVGSGAGFPGIPLAMISPKLQVTLIESNAKKCAFLSEVIRHLALDNVEVARSRMEEVGPNLRGLDFITARALGHHLHLFAWAQSTLSKSGKLVLWVGDRDVQEISRSPNWSWQAPVRIPGSRSRVLLLGIPVERERANVPRGTFAR